MAAHKKIDWERIEPAFRAGMRSILQIAADYEAQTNVKVSHTAINKHFKALGVTRDLSSKIKAKADAIVSASMVSGKVSVETNVKDATIINVGALELANVHLSQRKDIARNRALANKMLDELENVSNNLDLFERLGELLIDPNDEAVSDKSRKAQQERQYKRMEAFNRALDMSSRIDSLKKLSDVLKTLITLEREAYGLDKEPEVEKPLTALTDEQLNNKIERLLAKAGR